MGDDMREKVEEVLERNVRPILRADGGDVELVDVDEKDGVVKVRLMGACVGCPFSQMTKVGLIEKALKDNIPEIKSVVMV